MIPPRVDTPCVRVYTVQLLWSVQRAVWYCSSTVGRYIDESATLLQIPQTR